MAPPNLNLKTCASNLKSSIYLQTIAAKGVVHAMLSDAGSKNAIFSEMQIIDIQFLYDKRSVKINLSIDATDGASREINTSYEVNGLICVQKSACMRNILPLLTAGAVLEAVNECGGADARVAPLERFSILDYFGRSGSRDAIKQRRKTIEEAAIYMVLFSADDPSYPGPRVAALMSNALKIGDIVAELLNGYYITNSATVAYTEMYQHTIKHFENSPAAKNITLDQNGRTGPTVIVVQQPGGTVIKKKWMLDGAFHRNDQIDLRDGPGEPSVFITCPAVIRRAWDAPVWWTKWFKKGAKMYADSLMPKMWCKSSPRDRIELSAAFGNTHVVKVGYYRVSDNAQYITVYCRTVINSTSNRTKTIKSVLEFKTNGTLKAASGVFADAIYRATGTNHHYSQIPCHINFAERKEHWSIDNAPTTWRFERCCIARFRLIEISYLFGEMTWKGPRRHVRGRAFVHTRNITKHADFTHCEMPPTPAYIREPIVVDTTLLKRFVERAIVDDMSYDTHEHVQRLPSWMVKPRAALDDET